VNRGMLRIRTLTNLIISDMRVVNDGFAVVMHGWESIGCAGNRLRLYTQLRDCLPASYVRLVVVYARRELKSSLLNNK